VTYILSFELFPCTGVHMWSLTSRSEAEKSSPREREEQSYGKKRGAYTIAHSKSARQQSWYSSYPSTPAPPAGTDTSQCQPQLATSHPLQLSFRVTSASQCLSTAHYFRTRRASPSISMLEDGRQCCPNVQCAIRMHKFRMPPFLTGVACG